MTDIERKQLPAEGILTGVAPVNLKEVEAPAFSNDEGVWQEAGEVKKLYIYPVKSMRGFSVPSAEVNSL